ncbi:MAG: hypothetical protein NVSMB24_35280 [Mucilaginibacter sp.]
MGTRSNEVVFKPYIQNQIQLLLRVRKSWYRRIIRAASLMKEIEKIATRPINGKLQSVRKYPEQGYFRYTQSTRND